jgi:hypothetical protein
MSSDPRELDQGAHAGDEDDVGVLWVRVDDPQMDGYRRPAPPLGLSAEATARRGLAQALADDLADPPYRLEGVGHDYPHSAMKVAVDYRPVRRMLDEVDRVAEAAIGVPGETWVAHGPGGEGLVVRVHGPAWSLVFAALGPVEAVYVCSDEVPGIPLRVAPDGDVPTKLSVMAWQVLAQLERIAPGGDKYVDDRGGPASA